VCFAPQVDCISHKGPTLPAFKSIGVRMSNLIDFGDSIAEFTWSVISSSSEDMSSNGISKTYLAMLRFFAQHPTNLAVFIPLVLVISSQYPAISLFRRMLVRLKTCTKTSPAVKIRHGLSDLLTCIPGPFAALSTITFPFLTGRPLTFATPPTDTTLPPLPHGSIIVSALNAIPFDHLKSLLASLLLESKLVLVTVDPCLSAVFCEVLSTLLWPFVFTFPIIPWLPTEMTELVGAPVPFVIGVDSVARIGEGGGGDDLIVYDLDMNRFRSEAEPVKLPEALDHEISAAGERFMQSETGTRRGVEFNARESKAERRFRVSICCGICQFVRGIEHRMKSSSLGLSSGISPTSGIVRPPVDGFTSAFVLTQMFHNFVDTITAPRQRFFHDVMDLIDMSKEGGGKGGFLSQEGSERVIMAAVKTAEAGEKGGKVFVLGEEEEGGGKEEEEKEEGAFVWLRDAENQRDSYNLAVQAAAAAAKIIGSGSKIPKSPVRRGEGGENVGEGLQNQDVVIGKFDVLELVEGMEGEDEKWEDVVRRMTEAADGREENTGEEEESRALDGLELRGL